MNEIGNLDLASLKARNFLMTSYMFGLISPILFIGTFVVFWTLIVVVISGLTGLGFIGIYVFANLLIFAISIPLGIIAIIFGTKAWNIMRLDSTNKKVWFGIAICIGYFDVVAPIILLVIGMVFPHWSLLPNFRS